jgi:ribonuclease Z
MDMDVVFLGTGGSVPTARRSTACVLVRVGGERLLFDCGEGSQRQMQRSTGLVQVDEIYVTHLHADHYLGIPGLLKTYDLNGRERPLRIVGPPGLIELFKSLRRIFGRLGYEVDLIELDSGEPVRHGDYEVSPFAVEHRMTAYGYALVEDTRPGRFDPEVA